MAEQSSKSIDLAHVARLCEQWEAQAGNAFHNISKPCQTDADLRLRLRG